MVASENKAKRSVGSQQVDLTGSAAFSRVKAGFSIALPLLSFRVPGGLLMGPLGYPSKSPFPDGALSRCPASVVGVR